MAMALATGMTGDLAMGISPPVGAGKRMKIGTPTAMASPTKAETTAPVRVAPFQNRP